MKPDVSFGINLEIVAHVGNNRTHAGVTLAMDGNQSGIGREEQINLFLFLSSHEGNTHEVGRELDIPPTLRGFHRLGLEPCIWLAISIDRQIHGLRCNRTLTLTSGYVLSTRALDGNNRPSE